MARPMPIESSDGIDYTLIGRNVLVRKLVTCHIDHCILGRPVSIFKLNATSHSLLDQEIY
jgi:hypothetical protein